jgi:hypothetical protein
MSGLDLAAIIIAITAGACLWLGGMAHELKATHTCTSLVVFGLFLFSIAYLLELTDFYAYHAPENAAVVSAGGDGRGSDGDGLRDPGVGRPAGDPQASSP